MAAEPTVAAGGLDKLFHFTRSGGPRSRRDMLAGLTTFIVMSYIIFVNPSILGLDGKGLPVRRGPHVHLPRGGRDDHHHGRVHQPRLRHRARAWASTPWSPSASFSLGQGLTFPQAMGLIFLEGLAILVLVLTGFREAIFKAIPLELKKAIVVGIGFFILFIGLVDGGLVVGGGGTVVSLGQLRRRAGAGHHLRPRGDHHHAGARLALRGDPRHRLLHDLRDDPQLRLRQDVVRRGHRRVAEPRSCAMPDFSLRGRSSTSGPSASSA